MSDTLGPIEPTGPLRRGYEQTWWGKLYVHYKLATPIISGIILLVAMVGFQFQTPAQWFNRIEKRIEAVELRTTRLEQQSAASDLLGAAERKEISEKLDVVVRVSCRAMTAGERELTSVCDQVGGQ